MSAAPKTFDAGTLAEQYAALDALPEVLYAPVVAHPRGDLLARVRGVLVWREALLEGKTPSPDAALWPGDGMPLPVGETLRGLGVIRYCRGEPAIVDALLIDLLRIASGAVEWREVILRDLKAQIEARERAKPPRQQVKKKRLADLASFRSEETRGEDVPLAKQLRQAEEAADERVKELAIKALEDAWRERARLWIELEAVFGALGELIGAGWDLARGVLRSQGWLEVVRLRGLLEHLPAMQALMRRSSGAATCTRSVVPAMSASMSFRSRAMDSGGSWSS